jgi:uncharacterized protein (TIGR03435 family)
MQAEIKRKFGLTGWRETRQSDILLLKVQSSSAPNLKPSDSNQLSGHSGKGYYDLEGQTLSGLAWFLEDCFQVPVIDQSGLTNRFDMNLKWDETDIFHPNLANLKLALLDQLGLELVSTNIPIEMLIVEKVK